MPLSNTRLKTVSFPFIAVTILAALALGLALYLVPPMLVPMLALILLIAIPLLLLFTIASVYVCCPKDKAFVTPPSQGRRLSPTHTARPVASRAEVPGIGVESSPTPGSSIEKPLGTNALHGESETTKFLAPAPTP